MNPGGNTKNLMPPWKPGQSGNPNGRPKKAQQITEKAQDHAEEALKAMIDLLKSEDERVKLTAAQAILDRGLGKPKQEMDVKSDVTHHGSEPVSDTARWIAETLRARADSQAQKSVPN